MTIQLAALSFSLYTQRELKWKPRKKTIVEASGVHMINDYKGLYSRFGEILGNQIANIEYYRSRGQKSQEVCLDQYHGRPCTYRVCSGS